MEGGVVDEGPVCVTGGTGYVASWLIKKLLEKGYTIRTTVRSATDGNERDLSYLTNLPGAAERLQIFGADLSDPESFGPAVKGCARVFPTAHPIDYTRGSPEEVVTRVPVGGLRGTVKRVVYTATASACLFSGEDLDVADEGTWSDLEVCRRSPFYPNYLVSKTVTEKEALEFGERHGLEVVTCVLPTVIGPFITPSVPGSVGLTASILAGTIRTTAGLSDPYHTRPKSALDATFMIAGNVQWYELLPMWYLVHTDDAARALIFLMESPKVKGRYVSRALELRTHELVEFMSGRYPELNITITDKMKELKDRKATSLSSKKLLDAGFEYKYGVEEMFDDM
ncbi:hypothetical protein EUGRSUZ_D02454, partial [Eucalyptus grandis]